MTPELTELLERAKWHLLHSGELEDRVRVVRDIEAVLMGDPVPNVAGERQRGSGY